MKTIALIGNPNSGKSTLFNALTGASAFVGNWPGVTVERKEGNTTINGNKVRIMDTPGIYSLSPYSPEEKITRDYLLADRPEAIINIVDASNLERNLYLTTQLIELDIPVIVALNMMDVVEQKGEKLNAKALAKELGCPVVEISARKKTGLDVLKNAAEKALSNPEILPGSFAYADDIADALKEIKNEYQGDENADFVSLRILTGDRTIVDKDAVANATWEDAANRAKALEKKYDDDIESVIAEQRYVWIQKIIGGVYVKRRTEKLSISDKIDRVLTNKWVGLPIFLAIIYGIYWLCLNPSGVGKRLVGITFTWVINLMIWTSVTLTNLGVAPWLVSLVSDGIVFGVGIVVAFIPYLMMLFICLSILEECGYMSRVAFIFDRIFRKFGLSGKSFIPMMIGTGCTVQAVASARTIENENDRKMTIFLTPFMPCATKMPVIMLTAGVLAGGSAWVAPICYVVAIIFIILGGIFLKHTWLKGEPAPFVMELPEYKVPTVRGCWNFVWEKTKSFFKKASSIIVVTTVIIWFLKYFSVDWTPVGADIENSILATLGKLLRPLFVPLGFGDWRLIAALITGYVAKDNVLGTLGVIFAGQEITVATFQSMLTPAAAVSFLLFFILSSPCFAAMGAMQKELHSNKLAGKAIGFQIATAWITSFVVFQVLHLFMA